MTVHQLAVAMGYSEDRSVYYWLRKAGHKGLRDFKAEVLSSSTYGDESRPANDIAQERRGGYSPSVYVLRSSEYVPWLLPGDRLILDQELPLVTGRLVMVHFESEPGALRRYVQGPPDFLVHPTNPRVTTRLESESEPSIISVARVIRDAP